MSELSEFSTHSSCPQSIIDKMDDYLLGRLSPDEQKEVEIHYFDCQLCLEALKLRQEVRNFLKTEGPELLSDNIAETAAARSKTRYWRYVGYAAAACLAILVLTRLFPMFFDQSTPEQFSLASRLAAIDPYQSAYFTENPLLEGQLDATYRSAGRLTASLPDSIIYRQPQNFSWERKSVGGQLFFILLNNKADEVLKETVEPADQSITVNRPLPPGRYYWLLEDSLETLHVGRFFVFPSAAPTK